MQWFIETLFGIENLHLGEGEWSIFWRNAPVTWALVLIIIPLVFLASYYFYRKESTSASKMVKMFLSLVRCFLIFLVLIIIFEPVIVVETMLKRESNLLVLLDDSVSMSFDAKFSDKEERDKLIALIKTKDEVGVNQDKLLDSLNRLELVSKVLTNTYSTTLGKLAEKYKVKLYTFSSQLVNKKMSSVTEIKALGKVTALGDALSSAVNTLSGEPLAGIVLISDGQSNAGSDVLKSVEMLLDSGVMPPVWTIPSGATRQAKDIEVINLEAAPVAVANDFVEFKFAVKNKGFGGVSVPVILKEDDRIVAKEKINLIGAGRQQQVVLKYKPSEPGEYLCKVEIPFQEAELIKENNLLKHHLKVIDEKIRVLYIESFPRWEYRVLQNAMKRDRSILLSCWLIDSDPEFPQESSPGVKPLRQLSLNKKDLYKYDVVIIGDVSPRHLADPTTTGSAFTDLVKIMDNISSFVSDMGGGVAFISGGRYNPRSFKDTPFADLLPVILEDTEYYTYNSDELVRDTFKLKLTASGKESIITRLLSNKDENIELWEDNDKQGDGLSSFWWFYPVRKPKPGADVLATHASRKNNHGYYPVFATQWYGSGRVFFSATDETWRWRKFVGDKYFYTFWSEVIRDLRGGRLLGNKRYNIKIDKPRYVLGDKMKISARIYDDDFKPLEEPFYNAHLELPDGIKKDLELKGVSNNPGLYEADYKVTDKGNFWIWIGPEGLGMEKERAYLSFFVTSPMHEYENPMVNKYVLEEISRKTDGEFIPLYEIESLTEKIKPRGSVVLTESKEHDLWDSPFFFILFILAITTEWVVRKLARLL